MLFENVNRNHAVEDPGFHRLERECGGNDVSYFLNASAVCLKELFDNFTILLRHPGGTSTISD